MFLKMSYFFQIAFQTSELGIPSWMETSVYSCILSLNLKKRILENVLGDAAIIRHSHAFACFRWKPGPDLRVMIPWGHFK